MNKSIIPIFVTVFLDLLGVGIVIPIAAPLLLNPENHIFDLSTPFNSRSIILGFLLASYAMAQFFGAPILGALADKYGRKKLLTLSLIGTFVGYLIFAWGIYEKSIELLFLGRILDGFTGGNIAIAMSAISDVSTPENRAKNFGLIGMSFGLGFILGPYIGGKLADSSILSWFNYITPYLFAAGLSVVNIILVSFYFKETLVQARETKINIFTGFRNLQKAFSSPNLRIIFTVVFLTSLGFNFYTQFFQVFMIGKFQYSASNIADLFAYLGIWVALVQGSLTRVINKYMSSARVISIFSLVLAISLIMLLLPEKSIYIYYILPIMAVGQGLVAPNSNALVSMQASASEQGEILGINQSMQSLAMSLPPIIAGYITTININLPILCAAAFVFLSWLIFVFLYKPTAVAER